MVVLLALITAALALIAAGVAVLVLPRRAATAALARARAEHAMRVHEAAAALVGPAACPACARAQLLQIPVRHDFCPRRIVCDRMPA